MFYTSNKYTNHYYCFIDNKVLLINANNNTVKLITDINTLNKIYKYKDKEILNTLTIFNLRYLVSNYLLDEIDNYTKLITEYKQLHKTINTM